MNASVVTCTKCHTVLAGEVLNTPELVSCPGCEEQIRVLAFPALLQGVATGSAGENIVVEGEAGCFYHPQKRAVVACEGCGRFVCALCELDLNGQKLCPACLETGNRKGKIKNLQNHRTLYDNQALALALFPLIMFWVTIVTAPIALFLAIRYWNSPSSVIPRSKIRYIFAIVLAGMQIIGWGIAAFFFFNH